MKIKGGKYTLYGFDHFVCTISVNAGYITWVTAISVTSVNTACNLGD